MKSVYSAVRTGSCKWSGLRFVFKWLTHPFSWPVQCILFKAVPVPWILITSIYVRYRILRRLRPLQGVLHILRVASCIIGIVSIPVSYSGNRGLRILAPNPCLVRDSSWYFWATGKNTGLSPSNRPLYFSSKCLPIYDFAFSFLELLQKLLYCKSVIK